GDRYSYSLRIIKGNPPSTALEFTPACGGTRTGFDLGNREYAFPRIFSGLGIIRSGAFTNIQIRCADLYQKWRSCPARCSLLSGVNYLPALIIYGISRIGIRTYLGVIQ